MRTPASGGRLPRARRHVESCIEAGEGISSAVPASCLSGRLRVATAPAGGNGRKGINIIAKRALACHRNSMVYEYGQVRYVYGFLPSEYIEARTNSKFPILGNVGFHGMV